MVVIKGAEAVFGLEGAGLTLFWHRNPGGRFAFSTSSQIVREDNSKSGSGREPTSTDSIRSTRTSGMEGSLRSIFVMSVQMKATFEISLWITKTVTVPAWLWLWKTLGDLFLPSAKPSGSGGCENAVEHLENLPKSRKCFGTPRPSPWDVACLDVVLPAEVCLEKESL